MVMTVMIVLGIGTVNGLIIKRFLFYRSLPAQGYRLWIPKPAVDTQGSELHDDAIVLKIMFRRLYLLALS